MYKILIAEDEQVLRELMAMQLTANEYEVYSAEDGEQAWKMAQKVKPDLILLDLLMPKKTGYDFLKDLRAHPQVKKTPCIVISNSGQIDDLNRAFECGANDVLIKAEFNPAQVVVKVQEQLAKEAERTPLVK